MGQFVGTVRTVHQCSSVLVKIVLTKRQSESDGSKFPKRSGTALERAMAEHSPADQDPLINETSSDAAHTAQRVEVRSSLSTRFGVLVAVAAYVFGVFSGLRLPMRDRGANGTGHGAHRNRVVTEYDLVSIRYATPAAFEADVRSLGVTEKEYATCASSMHTDPRRKVCSKVEVKCFMKKLKYEKDAHGDIRPTYVTEGASEIQCPVSSSIAQWLRVPSDDEYDYWGGGNSMGNNGWNGWPIDCGKRFEDSRKWVNICYGKVSCSEEVSQWSTEFPYLNVSNSDARDFYINWSTMSQPAYWSSRNTPPSWYGGPNPSNITYPSSAATFSAPYQGKFCLQKAALKALLRRGWELIEPEEAFKPARRFDGRFKYDPWREDELATKTFKVKKFTPVDT